MPSKTPRKGASGSSAPSAPLSPSPSPGPSSSSSTSRPPQPFNFSTPSRSSTPSRAASSSSTPQPASHLLPREMEAPYHRAMRIALANYVKLASAWEAVVENDCARALSSFTRSAAEIDDILARSHDKEASSSDLAKEQRSSELATALHEAEEAREVLMEMAARLDKALFRLLQQSSALEDLLANTTASVGVERTFNEPMWGTWTMARFVEEVTSQSSRHSIQTAHLQASLRTLLRSGLAPLPLVPPASRSVGDETWDGVTDEDSTAAAGGPDDVAERMRRRRKARASVREEVLLEWTELRHFEGAGGRGCVRWVEEVCKVEVGRWDEG